ncbi:MBL fold metallo-hydrolase [uncultured Roseibium sp.]|uniref:MBL fold metallo-hydrolase n=1 Tax=uncultured Roseibium sp. TaxID=1936171 RepID=UPI002613E91C|nr:MBL fold metallo-hydrolase [uncultured Roseibium sp.]
MKRRTFLKSAGTMTLATPAILGTSFDAGAAPGQDVPSLDITWLGGATMLLICGELTLLTDPAFGEGDRAFQMGNPNAMFDLAKGPDVIFHKRNTPFSGIDLAPVDHVLVSHLHEDHFDQEAERMLPKEMPFFVPAHDRAKLAAKGFSDTRQADWGQHQVLKKGKVSVTISAVPAEHSENPEIAGILGPGNGYWLTFEQDSWQKTVYWTGDTFPTPRVLEAVAPLGRPDIFIPHLGGVGTTGPLGQISMGSNHVTDFVDRLKPGKILPVHHSTYALYLEPVYGLPAALENRSQGLDLVSEGTCLRYT